MTAMKRNYFCEKGAGTIASRDLAELTSTIASTGLTSGFGMRPGGTPLLWPATSGRCLQVD